VQAAALSLVAWLFLFHVGDAAQAVAASVLRAWRIATVPLVIYAVAIWGVGLGGGYWFAFDAGGMAPRAMQGAPGFWIAAATSLLLTALALVTFLAWMLRQRHQGAPPAPPPQAR
jgi:MATE family multidrug resistance protein